MGKIISGNSINLFIKQGNTYKSIAHSTTFSLEIKLEYEEVKSKDDEDVYYGVKPTNIYWELEGESLIVDDEDILMAKMMNNEKLRIIYGVVDDGATLPDYGYIGDCYITNLELQATTGEMATYAYTLNGCSKLRYGQITDSDEGPTIVFGDKTTPTLSFSSSTSSQSYNSNNDYDIGTINNPAGLPLKYKITKIQ